MKYLQPSYFKDFRLPENVCTGEMDAPIDLTWTWTVGDYCEAGLSMSDITAARLILLGDEKRQFVMTQDRTQGIPLRHLSRTQLNMIADSRKTIDLLIQNREMPLRTSIVAALTYCMELEPIIERDSEIEYQGLDWGYTEQPFRQLQGATQALGRWELKHSDLMHILFEFEKRFAEDSLLKGHMVRCRQFFEPLGGAGLKDFRGRFDAFMEKQDYLFENLMVYYGHRYFMSGLETWGIMPAMQLALISFVVIRCICATIWEDTGTFTDELFVALCCRYARVMERDQIANSALDQLLRENEMYSADRLQRLLWQ